MAEPNLIGGLAGGALIGAAAVFLLAVNGRIAGISGILGGLMAGPARGDRAWRLAFLAGLIAGAALYRIVTGALPLQLQGGAALLAGAGLLVGLGTGLGSGCTSGHGVCGIARRSPRSIAATAIFMITAMLTVYLARALAP
jgi:uncharacterized membrane protein YedE/YeeE